MTRGNLVQALLGLTNDEISRAIRHVLTRNGIGSSIHILDLTADRKDFGKAAGSDLLEGKLTLPLIYLLEKRPELTPKLEEIMFDGEYRTISREELKSELVSLGLIESIKQRASSHAEAARKSLAVLGDSEYRSSLEGILSFVIDRSM